MQPLLCQKVPADDGINLATDVYFPDGQGPFPVVLVRTPYNRVGRQGIARQFVRRGYAFVVQDCRGKYDSEGPFTPLVDEVRDGQATLDWVANQRWCNGRIGMWGRSYLGIVQAPLKMRRVIVECVRSVSQGACQDCEIKCNLFDNSKLF